jgi:peptidoglycan-associated lipoprotein
MTRQSLLLLTLVATTLAGACASNPPPDPGPPPPAFPGAAPNPSGTPPPPPPRPSEPPPVPREPMITADPLATMSPEEINANSPLEPVFFGYDSDELDEPAREALAANAKVLGNYGSWVITIEGHCDERGTPEYNLALGDRRALAAKNFLLSLGVPGDRIRTVSYGKEFPFDPGHDETAWSRNRRAHFMVVSK